MGQVTSIVEYKDEGFAILEDEQGKFLLLADTADLIDLGDPTPIPATGGYLPDE